MFWRSPRSAMPLEKSEKKAIKAIKAPAVGRTRWKASRERDEKIVRKICAISVVCVKRAVLPGRFRMYGFRARER